MTSIIEVSYESSNSEDEQEDHDEIESVERGTASDADCEQSDDGTEDGLSAKTTTGSLATVISGILRKKPTKHKVILAKAKTDKSILAAKRKQEDVDAETSGEDDADAAIKRTRKTNDATLTAKSIHNQREERLKKKAWENLNRVKPEATDKEQEHKLQRVATKGVIQLFNAVRKQQKLVEEKLKEAGSSVRRRDSALQKMTKGQFLDVLKNTAAKVVTDPYQTQTTAISAVQGTEGEEDPKWSILREDFMMGANMKDWDKEGSGGQEDMEENEVE